MVILQNNLQTLNLVSILKNLVEFILKLVTKKRKEMYIKTKFYFLFEIHLKKDYLWNF